MKALLLTGPSEFELRDFSIPVVGPQEVLVAVRSVGVCASDVHGMTGATGRRIPPLGMGHEASCEVVDCGPGSDRSLCGKRVTFDSTVHCGCRDGALAE